MKEHDGGTNAVLSSHSALRRHVVPSPPRDPTQSRPPAAPGYQFALLLADEGVSTVSAGNGRDALELLQRLAAPPSLILMDLMMPIMDGWELHRRIAGDDSLSRTPVIVMSAHPRDWDLPAVTWLQKPLGVDELLSTIREAVPS